MAPLEGRAYSAQDVFNSPLQEFENAYIGVEATSYLQNMIDNPPSHEPLLAALGGDPMTLKSHIQNELDLWKQNNITPIFVFDGQSSKGKDEISLWKAKHALKQTQHAWDLYGENHPETAVKTFGGSGAIRAQDLYRILQEVLAERDLDFVIAPFSACAQIAYLESLDTPYIDGIMGSQELLLYDIKDNIILPPTVAEWDNKVFQGISKSSIIKKLNVTPDMLSDALLMIGTSFLPAFPPLTDRDIITTQPFNIKDAANLLRTSEKSVTTTCAAFNDILQVRDPNWLDKFRKAKMSVKHCGTVQENGTIHIRDYDHLTADNVEYLGLQLPAELYHYLSKALISPKLMNNFQNLQAMLLPTLDGVVSDEYRRLVTRTLVPLKETAAAMIVSRIHRVFQFKEIELKFWFDDTAKETIIPRNVQPNQQADTWGVKDRDLKAQEAATGTVAGTLSFALLSLQQKDFSAKTISKEKVTDLKSDSEVLANVLWRLLHLRGYINDKHELTSWGRALATTLKSAGPAIKEHKDIHHVEEAAFLAFELLRFDNLNSRNRHSELIGGPLRGSDEDRQNCILIGRTACLLKLRHHTVGYTGPLSKNLLAFHSIIKAVRETDRDLVEAVAASMFLNSQAIRARDDYGKLGRSLPFSTDVDIALGIAVKTYLDDFVKLDASKEDRHADKAKYVAKYLPHSINFAEDLDVAFRFFDAVYAGVKTLGDEIGETDRKAWNDANAYLALRR